MKYAIALNCLIAKIDVGKYFVGEIPDEALPTMHNLVNTANFVTESLPAINKRQAELMRRAAEALDGYETMNRQDIRRIIDELDAEAGEMES
jgi:hypothetical protein